MLKSANNFTESGTILINEWKNASFLVLVQVTDSKLPNDNLMIKDFMLKVRRKVINYISAWKKKRFFSTVSIYISIKSPLSYCKFFRS